MCDYEGDPTTCSGGTRCSPYEERAPASTWSREVLVRYGAAVTLTELLCYRPGPLTGERGDGSRSSWARVFREVATVGDGVADVVMSAVPSTTQRLVLRRCFWQHCASREAPTGRTEAAFCLTTRAWP